MVPEQLAASLLDIGPAGVALLVALDNRRRLRRLDTTTEG